MDARRGMSEEHSCVGGTELQVPGDWRTQGTCALLHCSFSVAWRHQGQVWEPLKDWHKRLVRGKIDPFLHRSLLKLYSSMSMTFCNIITDSKLPHVSGAPSRKYSNGCFLFELERATWYSQFWVSRDTRAGVLDFRWQPLSFRFEKIFAFLELSLEERLFV